jgi:hypothetical protein
MFAHTVYFWLRPELSDEEVQTFYQGLDSLCTIDCAQHISWGKPANTDRAIIDRSYSAGLITVFADEAAHDIYQDHPVHEAFRQTCGHLWHKIVIYDTVS